MLEEDLKNKWPSPSTKMITVFSSKSNGKNHFKFHSKEQTTLLSVHPEVSPHNLWINWAYWLKIDNAIEIKASSSERMSSRNEKILFSQGVRHCIERVQIYSASFLIKFLSDIYTMQKTGSVGQNVWGFVLFWAFLKIQCFFQLIPFPRQSLPITRDVGSVFFSSASLCR